MQNKMRTKKYLLVEEEHWPHFEIHVLLVHCWQHNSRDRELHPLPPCLQPSCTSRKAAVCVHAPSSGCLWGRTPHGSMAQQASPGCSVGKPIQRLLCLLHSAGAAAEDRCLQGEELCDGTKVERQGRKTTTSSNGLRSCEAEPKQRELGEAFGEQWNWDIGLITSSVTWITDCFKLRTSLRQHLKF